MKMNNHETWKSFINFETKKCPYCNKSTNSKSIEFVYKENSYLEPIKENFYNENIFYRLNKLYSSKITDLLKSDRNLEISNFIKIIRDSRTVRQN